MPRTDRPIRLTAVLTHPVQYYSPWFSYITAHAPAIDLTVLYAAAPTPQQQGIGFGRAFEWDIPLVDGYRAEFARASRSSDRFDASTFRGVDVADIRRRLLPTDPDVVLLPGWQSVVLVRALAACRRHGIPALYRGDTHLGNAPSGWRYPMWRLKTRALLAMFSGYLAVGSRARDYLMDFGVDHRRVFSAPHAVDTDRFARTATESARQGVRNRLGIEPSAFVVAFVGKFEEKKCPADLIRAAARLGRPATLLFVGSGPLESSLKAAAAAAHVDTRFVGFVNQAELGEFYAAADCVALPSDWGESWGLVINEALAAGVPVVTSDRVGCAPDLVDDSTGATFPFGDVEAFARALHTVRERSASAPYASRCRDRATAYGFAAATAGLVDACRSVTSPAARPSAPIRVVACCGHMVTVTGLERHTFETLRALRQRGAAVHCIVNSWEHHRIAALANAVGATWSVGVYHATLRRRDLTPRRVALMLLDVIRTSAGLLRDVRRTDATAVLLPDHLAVVRNAPALLWLRARRRVRVVMGLGNAPDTGRFYRWYWRTVQNLLVDHFVCNSRFTFDELLATGVGAGKLSWSHNVLPPDRRSYRPLPFEQRIDGRIVYVGQIIPGKGLDCLLEATGLLVRRAVDVTVDVVGDMEGWTTPAYGAYRRAIRERAHAPDLVGRVTFLGWQDNVMPFLARSSVHCAPSRPELREGFGLVNLEAKQVGVPSVVFASGAFPEVVSHTVDGWVCSEPTPDALADGLAFFLTSFERRRSASDEAFRSAARFDPDAYAQRWWNVLAGDGVEVLTARASRRAV